MSWQHVDLLPTPRSCLGGKTGQMSHKLDSYYHCTGAGRAHKMGTVEDVFSLTMCCYLMLYLQETKQPGVDFLLTAQSPGRVR